MRRQGGSVTIELAILAPSLMLVASLAVFVGRVSFAWAAVDSAAYSAARVASLARDPDTARTRARDSAIETLAGQGLTCQTLDVTVDTSQFAYAIGEPAAVTVAIACQVSLADAALPGIPPTHWVSAQYSSPLDLYRSRTG
ncbi:TadE/TadG family type IV pilus assembly protein [Solwaraspora sp. WMMD1047]|uniref:TadE/TadG family type IV pilus assembly protein n=1 Tax=Solwaraspora sp. WMMD1047 TaxID=3016102 RepID=UPI002416463B|nr:TadE/TadG family type IV pilus assembly protein [Solwaraspora sp. WMMD1047]MDG4833005.1 TadE/TadG family type IV pilus assembly protein [Solwaraspora sp. WMMD1047]